MGAYGRAHAHPYQQTVPYMDMEVEQGQQGAWMGSRLIAMSTEERRCPYSHGMC